jgi:hypothetical protein
LEQSAEQRIGQLEREKAELEARRARHDKERAEQERAAATAGARLEAQLAAVTAQHAHTEEKAKTLERRNHQVGIFN